jgi:hypothetical protein
MVKLLELQDVVFGGKCLLILSLLMKLRRENYISQQIIWAVCPVWLDTRFSEAVMREQVRKSTCTQQGRLSVVRALGFGLYLGSMKFAAKRRRYQINTHLYLYYIFSHVFFFTF